MKSGGLLRVSSGFYAWFWAVVFLVTAIEDSCFATAISSYGIFCNGDSKAVASKVIDFAADAFVRRNTEVLDEMRSKYCSVERSYFKSSLWDRRIKVASLRTAIRFAESKNQSIYHKVCYWRKSELELLLSQIRTSRSLERVDKDVASCFDFSGLDRRMSAAASELWSSCDFARSTLSKIGTAYQIELASSATTARMTEALSRLEAVVEQANERADEADKVCRVVTAYRISVQSESVLKVVSKSEVVGDSAEVVRGLAAMREKKTVQPEWGETIRANVSIAR